MRRFRADAFRSTAGRTSSPRSSPTFLSFPRGRMTPASPQRCAASSFLLDDADRDLAPAP